MFRHCFIYAVLLVILTGCGKADDAVYAPSFSKQGKEVLKEYIVGIHPLHNPQRLNEVYGPIIFIYQKCTLDWKPHRITMNSIKNCMQGTLSLLCLIHIKRFAL